MTRTYRLGPTRRVINTMMTAALRAGAGPKSNYLLTTTGRRSGRKVTTPVTLVASDGERWLVAPYGSVGWVHNVRASGEARLTRARRSEDIRVEEVKPEIAGPVLHRYVNQVPITAPFFEAKRTDPPERFAEEALRHPVFRVVSPTSE